MECHYNFEYAIKTIFTAFLVFKNIVALEYNCPSSALTFVNISGVTSGTINSNFKNEYRYGNNRDCSWFIDAGNGNRVQFRITMLHLEWTPTSGICSGYDFMVINEVSSKNENPVPIVSICGDRNPHFVVSSGRYISLRFKSNDRNIASYRGITLDFEVFNTSECPQGWLNPSPFNFCYMLINGQKEWAKAQSMCEIMQSNLIVINDVNENNYLKDYMTDKNAYNVWTALTDIEKEGSYKWFGKIPLKAFNKLPSVKSKEFDCVVLQNSGNWIEKHCQRSTSLFPFICQMNKGSPTQLMSVTNLVPETDLETGNPLNPLYLIIGIVIAIIVLAIAIGVFVYFYKRRNDNKRTETQVTPTLAAVRAPSVVQHEHQGTELNFVRSRDGGPAQDIVIREPESNALILPPSYEDAVCRGDSPRNQNVHSRQKGFDL